jgi:hypothetical protein
VTFIPCASLQRLGEAALSAPAKLQATPSFPNVSNPAPERMVCETCGSGGRSKFFASFSKLFAKQKLFLSSFSKLFFGGFGGCQRVISRKKPFSSIPNFLVG